jgi:hypothetical protein
MHPFFACALHVKVYLPNSASGRILPVQCDGTFRSQYCIMTILSTRQPATRLCQVLLGKDPKFFFTFAGSVMVLLRDGVDTGSPKKVSLPECLGKLI